ncbi:MAG: biosynthetic-type acetolactate synthase large subunit [Treponema sp.]|nr:biosynthetic-type acetolactate synthase large subunit [Treponema sp.]
MKYTGARVLIESLIKNGVDTIFGYPGASVLNIYDELGKSKDRIRHILVSHEQHAVHAADGYARSSGKTGVCIATSGPGATNLVTGIATAFVDSVPLVAITGNVSLSLLGKDSFQEVDIAGITMPVVKHNWIAEDVNDLAVIINEAFIVAQSGRPGPVLIDIPRDVSSAVCEYEIEDGASFAASRATGTASNDRAERLIERTRRGMYSDDDIRCAVKLINDSKRLMIYAGGGVISSGAGEELVKLAETLNAPVALSLMGMGAIPRDHSLCTGLIGMYGTAASNNAVQNCDLLIALGARFSDRVTNAFTADNEKQFAKNAKIIHIDIDPAEINKNKDCDAFITGDLKEVLKNMIGEITEKKTNEWGNLINEWKALDNTNKNLSKENNYKTNSNKFLLPDFIISETAKKFGENAVVVTDTGQHQIWTAQYYPFKNPRGFLSSGGMGTMGFGMGASCGAKIANPDKPVILFTGDGSFRMNSGEIATMMKYKLPVLIIIFNNQALGMLRQWQTNYFKKRYFETSLENQCPDFIKLADAYGMRGFRAADEYEFLDALNKCAGILSSGLPALIEAVIDKDKIVHPAKF